MLEITIWWYYIKIKINYWCQIVIISINNFCWCQILIIVVGNFKYEIIISKFFEKYVTNNIFFGR